MNRDEKMQFGEVLDIYPTVRNTLEQTDDGVVFATVITSVIQYWADKRGIDPREITADIDRIINVFMEGQDNA